MYVIMGNKRMRAPCLTMQNKFPRTNTKAFMNSQYKRTQMKIHTYTQKGTVSNLYKWQLVCSECICLNQLHIHTIAQRPVLISSIDFHDGVRSANRRDETDSDHMRHVMRELCLTRKVFSWSKCQIPDRTQYDAIAFTHQMWDQVERGLVKSKSTPRAQKLETKKW